MNTLVAIAGVLAPLKPLDQGLCARLRLFCPPNAGGATIATLLQNVIISTLVLFWIIAFAFLIFGAYQYVTSGGNEEQIRRAKLTIIYAIVGIIIISTAGIVVNAVTNRRQFGPVQPGQIIVPGV